MMEWTPFTRPPKDGQLILVLCESPYAIEGTLSVTLFSDYLLQYNPKYYGISWMPAEPILNAPMGYDPKFGDDRLCLCGHSYYRHFDTYEEMMPVGCKYCHFYIEGMDYKKEIPVPKDVDVSKFTHDDWAPFVSICSGFRWDGVEV